MPFSLAIFDNTAINATAVVGQTFNGLTWQIDLGAGDHIVVTTISGAKLMETENGWGFPSISVPLSNGGNVGTLTGFIHQRAGSDTRVIDFALLQDSMVGRTADVDLFMGPTGNGTLTLLSGSDSASAAVSLVNGSFTGFTLTATASTVTLSLGSVTLGVTKTDLPINADAGCVVWVDGPGDTRLLPGSLTLSGIADPIVP